MEKTPAKRFEDLIAWQKAREMTREIYKATMNGGFERDFGLRDQIRRSAVSVMSNLAEGFERGGRPEFHQYLVIAKGSCAEVRSQLYVAHDAGYVNKEELERLMNQANAVAKYVSALRSAVARQRDAEK